MIRFALVVVIQIALLIAVDSVVSKYPVFYYRRVHSLRSTNNHMIFVDSTSKKVAFVGASSFGSRICLGTEDKTKPLHDDACAVSEISNWLKEDYSYFKDFHFFDMTRSGVNPQAQYYLIQTLNRIKDKSLKYLVLDNIQKFDWSLDLNLKSGYAELYTSLFNELDSVPLEQQSARTIRFKTHLKAQLEKYHVKDQLKTWAGLAANIWQKNVVDRVTWLDRLIGNLKYDLGRASSGKMVEYWLNRYNTSARLISENQLDETRIALSDKEYVSSDEDFDFIELVHAAAVRLGAKLIILVPPDLTLFQPAGFDISVADMYRPAIEHFKNSKDVKLIDIRDLNYFVPSGSTDGLHPSMANKVEISRRILTTIEALDHEN